MFLIRKARHNSGMILIREEELGRCCNLQQAGSLGRQRQKKKKSKNEAAAAQARKIRFIFDFEISESNRCLAPHLSLLMKAKTGGDMTGAESDNRVGSKLQVGTLDYQVAAVPGAGARREQEDERMMMMKVAVAIERSGTGDDPQLSSQCVPAWWIPWISKE
ncbi:hypothetical protein BO99DRAFT_410577 [Aspergillus violaceofuscus CBS 115571]|uniref:Uncharacterized protein n=1 Tax=Aspergillus violaceofuscus (strain CBS 115571) TaxID=1450538 RepID=A0A2V5HHF8_ASPV1|nr:hypothetical protein BO99DRAFT_410577 [Aspergillus violaceofuscus CBS 115571]